MRRRKLSSLPSIARIAILAACFQHALAGSYQMSSVCLPLSPPQRLDPLLTPGTVSSHAHHFFGSTALQPKIDFNLSTVPNANASCNAGGDFSLYWTAGLYAELKNGSFIYAGDPTMTARYYWADHDEAAASKPFPDGFRTIAGDQTARAAGNSTKRTSLRWNHSTDKDPYSSSKTAGDTPGFPQGLRATHLEALIWSGSCSNGQPTSPDFQSHVTYTQNSVNGPDRDCPKDFPVDIPQINFLTEWSDLSDTVWAHADDLKNPDQPFVLANGDTTGYSWHVDFIDGWAHDKFNAALNDCRVMGEFYTASLCKDLSDVPSNKQYRKTPVVNERTSGPALDKLPGNNPTTGGPDPVSPKDDPDKPCILPNSTAQIYVADQLRPFLPDSTSCPSTAGGANNTKQAQQPPEATDQASASSTGSFATASNPALLSAATQYSPLSGLQMLATALTLLSLPVLS